MRLNKLFFFVLLPICSFANEVLTLSEVTVHEELDSKERILYKKDLELSSKKNLLEALNYYENIEITHNGGLLGNSNLYYRGLDSKYIKVLINGVEVNDPANINRVFDFSLIGIDEVERVEIIKGASSVLYGSDAVGAVINVVTLPKIKKKNYARTHYGNEKSLSISHGGIFGEIFEDSSKSSARGGKEKDKIQRGTLSLNKNFKLKEYNITSFATFKKSFMDFDSYDFVTGNPVDHNENKNIHSSQTYGAIAQDKKFKLKLSYHRLDRNLEGEERAHYMGQNYSFDGAYGFKNLTIGSSFYKENMESSYTKKINSDETSFYSLLRLTKKFKVGARAISTGETVGSFDYEDLYLNHFGFHLGLGESVKKPSLYQKLNSQNKLKSEKAKNISADLSFKNHLLTFFHYEIENALNYNVDRYENMDNFRTKGFEYKYYHFYKKINYEVFYSTQSFERHKPLRRAKEKASLTLDSEPSQKHKIFYAFKWLGNREDISSKLKPYNISALSYLYNDFLKVSVDNLFNEDYELVKGYSVDRRNYSIELSMFF